MGPILCRLSTRGGKWCFTHVFFGFDTLDIPWLSTVAVSTIRLSARMHWLVLPYELFYFRSWCGMLIPTWNPMSPTKVNSACFHSHELLTTPKLSWKFTKNMGELFMQIPWICQAGPLISSINHDILYIYILWYNMKGIYIYIHILCYLL